MCCTYTFVIIVFSHSWYLDMYINPSQYISAVFIALASTMLILLLIVAILKHFEKVLFFFSGTIQSFDHDKSMMFM